MTDRGRAKLPTFLIVLGLAVLVGSLVLHSMAEQAVGADGSVNPVIGWLGDRVVVPILGADASPAQISHGLRNGLLATAGGGFVLALLGWVTRRRSRAA